MNAPMPLPHELQLEDYVPDDLDLLIPLWRASFEQGVGIVDPHPLAEQRAYFLAEVRPGHRVRVARWQGRLAGFCAATPQRVAQLYVAVDRQGLGIGRALLEEAKVGSVGRLDLYTFARNRGARAFYERQGFVEVERGFEPHWQLEDLRYEWRAAPA